jgi:hypothetical protein
MFEDYTPLNHFIFLPNSQAMLRPAASESGNLREWDALAMNE